MVRFFTNIGRSVVGDHLLGLLLNEATIILGRIFSMLFSDFRARAPINIPSAPIVALTEFFDTDAETNVHPLPVS